MCFATWSDAVNYCNLDDETPLAWACLGGNYDAFRELLVLKADVNYVNSFGMDPLMFTVIKNDQVRLPHLRRKRTEKKRKIRPRLMRIVRQERAIVTPVLAALAVLVVGSCWW